MAMRVAVVVVAVAVAVVRVIVIIVVSIVAIIAITQLPTTTTTTIVFAPENVRRIIIATMMIAAPLNVVLGDVVVVVVDIVVIVGENVLLHGGNLLLGAEPARPGGRDELLGDADMGLADDGFRRIWGRRGGVFISCWRGGEGVVIDEGV